MNYIKYLKRSIGLVIIVIVSLKDSIAQKVILYHNKWEAIWPMTNNSYNFFVPNVPCDSIVFKTNNGRIEQNKCMVYYTPDTIKNTTFKVYKKTSIKLELIDSINITIKENKETYAMVGSNNGGLINKLTLIANGGIHVLSYYFEGHAIPSSVLSYRLTTFNDSNAFTTIVFGSKYSEKAIEMLRATKENNSVLFSDIKIRTANNDTLNINPIQFIIN